MAKRVQVVLNADVLSLGKDGHIECPYCSRRYVLKEGAVAAHH